MLTTPTSCFWLDQNDQSLFCLLDGVTASWINGSTSFLLFVLIDSEKENHVPHTPWVLEHKESLPGKNYFSVSNYYITSVTICVGLLYLSVFWGLETIDSQASSSSPLFDQGDAWPCFLLLFPGSFCFCKKKTISATSFFSVISLSFKALSFLRQNVFFLSFGCSRKRSTLESFLEKVRCRRPIPFHAKWPEMKEMTSCLCDDVRMCAKLISMPISGSGFTSCFHTCCTSRAHSIWTNNSFVGLVTETAVYPQTQKVEWVRLCVVQHCWSDSISHLRLIGTTKTLGWLDSIEIPFMTKLVFEALWLIKWEQSRADIEHKTPGSGLVADVVFSWCWCHYQHMGRAIWGTCGGKQRQCFQTNKAMKAER